MQCPVCKGNRGIVQLTEDKFKDFRCLDCQVVFPMKHYKQRIKESELDIREVKFN